MGKDLVLNNDNIPGTNFYRSDCSCENTVSMPGIINLTAGKEKSFSGDDNFSLLRKKTLLWVIFSIFHSVVFAVKVIVLSVFSVIYFVIGGFAAMLYLVLYEKAFKTFLISLETRKKKNPYYYRWKNHHLELNYEM